MKRILIFLCLILCLNTYIVEAKTFKISPKSKNYQNRCMAWNDDSYGLIRSYVDELNNTGGGTLILKKGVYKISKPIYISSNVHIKLEKGVILKKTFDKRVPSQSMFQFVDRSRIEKMQAIMGNGNISEKVSRIKKKNKKLLYSKYNGVKNSSITGEGVIDLQNEKNAQALVIGHCKNIKIEGITFKNSNSNHFIELDATDGIIIKDCKFLDAKKSDWTNKEAINLDTPDLITSGFNCFWSAQDKTPNKNVKIINCKFSNLERGIGTHQFSENKYHTNIIIDNCSFTNVSVPIFGLNWKNIKIVDNSMSKIRKIGNSYDGNSIFLAGAENIKIINNTIENFEKPCIREQYNVSQRYYPDIYSKITDLEQNDILENNYYVTE